MIEIDVTRSSRARRATRWLGSRGLAVAAAAGLLSLATTSPVHAQATTAANARAAQMLFDEAKRLADQKDFVHACPKFVQSHQLDPAGGTILHAADCHEREGKLATAWGEYNDALSFAIKSSRPDREAVARARIDALSPKLAKLHVQLPATAKTRSGYTIWLDGAVLGNALVAEAPIPVDAGSHSVEARADGYVATTQTFTIFDGKEQTIKFDDLVADPAAKKAVDTEKPPAETSDRGQTQRIAGLAVGGVGVAGLIVGTIFGVRALAIGDQKDQCTLGGVGGCPQSAVDDQNKARTSGTISTIGFIAGGVLAAGGAVLYFTAPKRGKQVGARPPSLGFGGTSLFLAGEF